MIVVKLIGGLGNQIFQYAVGRHLAEINGTELKLDKSEFETYKLHNYGLWALNVKERFISSDECRLLKEKKKQYGKVYSLLSAKPILTKILENSLPFNADVLKSADNVYLDGYWQTQKYFLGIENILRREFSVKNKKSSKDKELAKHIDNCNSVSLHIRRGDYVSNSETNVVHSNCNSGYYNRCVEKIALKLHNPHFFIFSDDSEWADKNLNISYPVIIVDHNNAEKNYEDLRLWFADDSYDFRDVVPDIWEKV